MNIIVQYDTETRQCERAQLTTDILSLVPNSLVVSNIPNAGITVGEDTIPLDKFLRNLKHFTVNAEGEFSYYNGATKETLDTTRISMDITIPMSFTRANTVVNLGRL